MDIMIEDRKMQTKQRTKNIINDSLIKDIREVVDQLAHGTITITVYNQKITQIETSRKQQFEDIWRVEGGSGI